MYEDYYGFVEKPFSLTPDPKYLYKSESHANAFDLLQYAVRRREGFVVVTGDIGTGKTTICRALLEQLDRKTFTALVLNPFLSEEDLLKLILQDFGVVSREDVKRGRLAGVSKQELIETLNDFLLSLLPLQACALMIIDEAQNLPLQVLEQIRILSNLETDKEKLLQIVLVGQLNLQPLLRSPELRQLDQRVSIRYELKPLTRAEAAAYVSHRLSIAGGTAVTFTPRALEAVHRYSGGIPRLINLLCDRALLGGYAERTNRIGPDLVARAAENLDLRGPAPGWTAWIRRRVGVILGGLAVVATAAAAGTGALAAGLGMGDDATIELPAPPSPPALRTAAPGPQFSAVDSQADAAPGTAASATAGAPQSAVSFAVLVGSFQDALQSARLTEQLQVLGYAAYRIDIDLGGQGRWQQVLVGRYGDEASAREDEARIRRLPGLRDTRVIAVGES
jgi:general secretion pathway protein A